MKKSSISKLFLVFSFFIVAGIYLVFSDQKFITILENKIISKNFIFKKPKQITSAELKNSLTSNIYSIFFNNHENCPDKQENEKLCLKINGQYSCPLDHCVLEEELPKILNYKNTCLNQNEKTEKECLNNSLLEYKKLLIFQTSESAACLGPKKAQTACKESGLTWNCKIGICATTISLENYLNFYTFCNESEKCKPALNAIIKQICNDQFGNEFCLPQESFNVKNRACYIGSSQYEMGTWNSHLNICISEERQRKYFKLVRDCADNLFHQSLFKTNEMSKLFKNIPECINDLNNEILKKRMSN